MKVSIVIIASMVFLMSLLAKPAFSKFGDHLTPIDCGEGILKTSLNFEACELNGVQHGPSRQFHDNGQLARSTNYNHGVLDGKIATYFENGQLGSIRHLGNKALGDDRYEGFHTTDSLYFDEKGRLVKVVIMDEKGKFKSRLEFEYSNGLSRMAIEYPNMFDNKGGEIRIMSGDNPYTVAAIEAQHRNYLIKSKRQEFIQSMIAVNNNYDQVPGRFKNQTNWPNVFYHAKQDMERLSRGESNPADKYHDFQEEFERAEQ